MSLDDYQVEREFFVGVDSDGCVFDSMELKHKECFIPAFVKHYGLQGVSKYAREAAEFVNLYSKTRGCNRFPGLVAQLDLLRKRAEVRDRGIDPADPRGVREWLASEAKPSNPTLERALATNGDADLRQALAWSHEVNERIAAMGANVPPFPRVRECLERLAAKADIIVVSATPQAALDAEWREHRLSGFVRGIFGQELGTKRDMLALARRYGPGKALMIGDAPGDKIAADANGCLFFPINPGREESSWQRLLDEGIDSFFGGRFAGAYQQELIAEFEAILPSQPPWQLPESD